MHFDISFTNSIHNHVKLMVKYQHICTKVMIAMKIRRNISRTIFLTASSILLLATIVMAGIYTCLPRDTNAVAGDTYSDGDFNYTELDDGTYMITGLARSLSGDVVIPDTANGKTVTVLGQNINWSWWWTTNTLTIPASIEYIDENALPYSASALYFLGNQAPVIEYQSLEINLSIYLDGCNGDQDCIWSYLSAGMRAPY